MKKYIIYIFIAISGILWSCEDYLDIAPELVTKPEDVYGEFNSFREFSDYLYFLRVDHRDWFHRTWPSAFSDEAVCTNTAWGASFRMKQGDDWQSNAWYQTAEIGVDNTNKDGKDGGKMMPALGNARLALRHANICLENFHYLVDATEEEKNILMGEILYFRAYNYFQMIRRWGGMPILNKVLNPGDEFDLARESYTNSTNWLLKDLDEAIKLLPKSRPQHELGRVTKGMASAVKTMALLYASSPLMNESDTYNTLRCEQGIEAAIEVFKLEEEGIYRLLDWAEYEDNFHSKLKPVSDEAIVYNHFMTREGGDIKTGGIAHRFGGFQFFAAPTQNIVDLYETNTGLDIKEADSGYDNQNPYANRDPRFSRNIFVNGDLISTKGTKNYYFEPFIGGLDDPTKAKVSGRRTPRCGYMMKKFWPKKANIHEGDWEGWYAPWVEIRLSQVYLDFAEMANEAYGPNVTVPGTSYTALSAINKIRNRAGMPNVDSRYTTSTEIFRERIRNERSVELMFEGIHRWHDLRRWRQSVDKLSNLKRAHITKNPDGSFLYESVPVDDLYQVTFKERNYWYPLPMDDVYMLTNLEQNPGW